MNQGGVFFVNVHELDSKWGEKDNTKYDMSMYKTRKLFSIFLDLNSYYTFGVAATWNEIVQATVIATDDVSLARLIWWD